ncbi:MAG: cation transporter [Bacilli bacterium]|nr:cation transporter [Bacilli bacterium]
MKRFESVKKASILGIIGNLFLLIIKTTIGFITNSQSMIADAFNSAGDIFSSLMTFIGNYIASKPSDDDHNLGHGKAEYIYSMLISIVMILVGLFVFRDSFISIFNNDKYQFSTWLIVVCIITIIIKFALYIYTNKLSKQYNNLLISANSKDHRNDTLITLCNLIACILSLFEIFWFDGVVGVGISIWMIITSIKIFRESYDVLMDKSITDETREKVFEIINSHNEIKNVIHFNSTPVGYRYQISFTIFVDGNLSTFESHKIADDLEKEIGNKISEIYLTVIHVNPIDINEK